MATEQILDWNHVYLLGWYDKTGRAYLSTWMGDRPMVHVIVKNHHSFGPPLWRAPAPARCTLEGFPEDVTTLEDRVTYATAHGGSYAFGWYYDEPFERGT